MQLKNTITKLKSYRLYKPIMIVGLIIVSVILIWGSATAAKVAIDASYEIAEIPTNHAQNSTSFEYDDEDILTGNSRGGTKVSILRKESEDVEKIGSDNGSELSATQVDSENVNLGQAAEMNNLEYNIVKQILAELGKSDTSAGITDEQMADISNKYDVSMTEIENLVKKYQSQNASDAETIKSELGITEQELKTMVKQIETNVTNYQKTIEQKISSADRKASEMIANSQTLTDKQIKELASKIGVSDKELKDYIDKQNKATLTEAKTAADKAAKAAASQKADKTYVDDNLSTKITKDDLKSENVVTATYDESTNTLTFSQVN